MERKKIVPKAKFDANKQEELLRKLQQNKEDAVSDTPITAQAKIEIEEDNTVVAVNLQQNTANAVNIPTPNVERNSKIQRITVDMPIDLYEKMKDEVEDNGQTIKGFIVNLVKSHFKK